MDIFMDISMKFPCLIYNYVTVFDIFLQFVVT